jgi:hypothetical protein
MIYKFQLLQIKASGCKLEQIVKQEKYIVLSRTSNGNVVVFHMKFACEMEIQLYASEPLMKLITTYFY